MISTTAEERNPEATLYVGNLDPQCSEIILYELFLQLAPVRNVHLPKDRVSRTHSGFGFVEVDLAASADYCMAVFKNLPLYGKPLRIRRLNQDKLKDLDVGANLFVSGLDPLVDEQLLAQTFAKFGPFLHAPRIVRDTATGDSKGRGFVLYRLFEHLDRAQALMDNQFLMNRPIHVEYALKKDGRLHHGDAVERMLAASAKEHHYDVAAEIAAAGEPS